MNRVSLVVALLLFAAYTGCAIGEVPPPINMQNTVGNFWVNHTWDPEPPIEAMSLISGEQYGKFTGFSWDGSIWQTDTGIVSDLGDIGYHSTPEVFQKDGTWYLISGDDDGFFTGFSWDGSIWQTDTGIVSDLGDIGTYSTPAVFQKDGTWYLISGEGFGEFIGFNWTGSTWQTDTGIVSDLGDIGFNSAPDVFQKDGTWYLISGNLYGTFAGFNWTGSTWQTDTGIVSDLGDLGFSSAPEVFQKDGTWYLISGEYDGVFTGFNWTGSIWQTDTGIVSDLGDIGKYSMPTVFEQVVYATDTYNVSVNDVWHNTTPAHYNDTYSPHAWQNITVYAYNSSGGFGISEDSISQNTQIPNNPVTITNMDDWDGYVNHTITVDCNSVDADSDTPTFSCNRTDLFTDFDIGTGEGSWHAITSGTYHVEFGVADGYGSADTYIMTIEVVDLSPTEYVAISSSGHIGVHNVGVTYVYVDNPDLLPCLVSLGEAPGESGTSTSAATKHIPFESLWCDESGVVDKHWANGTHDSIIRYQHVPTTPWCDLGSGGGPDVSTSMIFTNCSDYLVVYGYTTDLDDRCWRCDPTIYNTHVYLNVYATASASIILYDPSGNLVNHAQVTIKNLVTDEIVHLWEDIDDGTIEMGITADTYQVVVRTFDGVFVYTCDLGADPIHEIVIPIHYNLKIHPVDHSNQPVFNVFAGLAEYTIINPQAFWGMDLSDQGYVPVTNCSGFAMCDIIAEKEGYVDYRVEALNWTSKSALVKDYRHNVVMEEE